LGLYAETDPRYGTGVGGSAATAPGGVHGLPAALTSFIGRAGPVREIASLLEQYRLVTVTGPGGSGKTRLAGEVARRMAARFADGVWLAELSPVPDPAQVASAVAAALGVREQPGTPSADTVAEVLARQQLLLVLDNCEHVIDAAADLCARLLAAADDVRIMATSREPLQVAGEARYRLAPLTLPEQPGDLPDSGGSEAAVLFADRARRADAGFTLDAQTGPAVARLVTRLDGMPLAIELAAARVEALGVTQLLDRLDNRFALLAGTDRLAPDRHRSLAATVEWSYRLLDEQERRVFRGLSVFPGPFTLEGAEAVAGPAAELAVLHLVDCSLLVPPRPGPDGRSRYGVLETLRAYGAERLADAREHDESAAALARYALRLAEEAAAGLQTTTGEAAAARRLDAEDATTRQALAWAMDHDPDVALRLAVALAPWWLLRGRAPGGYPVLAAAADRAEVSTEIWCAAQFWLGDIAFYALDLAGALDHFTGVRDAIGDLGPSRALAACLAGRSHTLSNLGRKADGAEEGRRSLAAAREVGDPAGQALALVYLSIAAHYSGDFGDGLALARQAEQIPADIPGWIARHCSAMLAVTLREVGDLAAAERACAGGLARTREVGDLHLLPGLLTNMAALDLPAGRIQNAAAHLHEALQIIARSGDWFELTNILSYCGDLCAAAGRRAEAGTAWSACNAHVRREGIQMESPWDALR
jgi:predicted ATPase